MKNVFFFAVICMLVSAVSNSAYAQNELAAKDQASVCFDIRVSRLLNSELIEAMDDKQVAMMQRNLNLPVDARKIKRVFGMFSMPESFDSLFGNVEIDEKIPVDRYENENLEIDKVPLKSDIDLQSSLERNLTPSFVSVQDFDEQAGPGQMEVAPINFRIEFEFVDEASAEEMLQSFAQPFDLDSSYEKDGATYYRPDEFAPKNMLLVKRSATQIAIGTEAFINAPKANAVFSDTLKNIWSQHGDAPLRFSAELVTAKELIQKTIDEATEGADPMLGTMLGLVKKVESLNLMIDPGAEEMIVLNGFGVDLEAAKQLRGGLDGMLGFAKFGAGSMVKEMSKTAPLFANAMSTVVNDLKVTGEGKECNLVIRKPEGMLEAVKEMRSVVRKEIAELEKLNRIRQVILSVHIFHDVNRKFPFDAAENDDLHEGLSWRVAILPYLDQARIYDSLALDEPSGSETNRKWANKMPEEFGADGSLSNVVFVRPAKIPKTFAGVTDGTSNTIALLELPEGVSWMENKDVSIDEALSILKNLKEGEFRVAAFYDGSVLKIPAGVDETLLKRLLNPADGEVVDWNELDF